MAQLTLEYIKCATGEFDPEIIFQVILSNRGILRIDSLAQCCNLRWLDLSRNSIISIENLEGLAQLSYLDLSHNKIQKVQHLDGLPALERLKLLANPISRLQDISGLAAVPTLRHLHFRNIDSTDFCPVCLQPEYQAKVFELCPSLVALDSKRRHLPDLDAEMEKVLNGPVDIIAPEPDPWFTAEDLRVDEDASTKKMEAALKPQMDDFEAALLECRGAVREVEEMLKAQGLKVHDSTS
mmetsp:Transcript_67437/g.161775  ORF Transcript_67437/g.161775 Transcript_67437/m.161775 type:complete len:239 (-) Transcript_67437:105-821(-)